MNRRSFLAALAGLPLLACDVSRVTEENHGPPDLRTYAEKYIDYRDVRGGVCGKAEREWQLRDTGHGQVNRMWLSADGDCMEWSCVFENEEQRAQCHAKERKRFDGS